MDVDEHDGLALVGERLRGVLEGVLAVLVLVDADGDKRVAGGVQVFAVMIPLHGSLTLSLSLSLAIQPTPISSKCSLMGGD